MSKHYFRISTLKTMDDFAKFIRQFPSKKIIEKVYKISKEIYSGDGGVNGLTRHVSTQDAINGNKLEQDVIIQPWQFSDLIYESILHSNDYRGLDEIDYDMFLLVLLQTAEYINLQTKPLIEKFHSRADINIFIYGFGGEQFKYQTKNLFYRNLIRELYILFGLSKKYPNKMNFDEDIKAEIGVEWENVVLVLFGVFINSLFDQNVTSAINNLSFKDNSQKEKIFYRVINHYSIHYDEIRKHPLGRQVFYTKPYIINQKNEIVSGSIYFNQFIVEHAPFWILRDFYMKKSKNENRDFTTYFGFLYEKYFEELCTFFNVEKEKIPEGKEERADWKINIGNHIFLIEQKSSLYSLSIKQQLTDFDKYKEEIKKKLFKGLSQLENTQNDLKIEKPLKIVLYYDEYFDANILPQILDEPDSPVKNDGLYFVANTMELEMLIELGVKNEKLFNVVIEDMIRRNKPDCVEGINLFKIMRDNKWKVNTYLLHPQFDKYKDLLKAIKDSHSKFKIDL